MKETALFALSTLRTKLALYHNLKNKITFQQNTFPLLLFLEGGVFLVWGFPLGILFFSYIQ